MRNDDFVLKNDDFLLTNVEFLRRLEKERELGVAREEGLAVLLGQVEEQLAESWAAASAYAAGNQLADATSEAENQIQVGELKKHVERLEAEKLSLEQENRAGEVAVGGLTAELASSTQLAAEAEVSRDAAEASPTPAPAPKPELVASSEVLGAAQEPEPEPEAAAEDLFGLQAEVEALRSQLAAVAEEAILREKALTPRGAATPEGNSAQLADLKQLLHTANAELAEHKAGKEDAMELKRLLEEQLAEAERAEEEKHKVATAELEKKAQKMTIVALVCGAVAFASSVAEAMGDESSAAGASGVVAGEGV